MPQAASLAAEIERAFGIKAELIKGTTGVFDVAAGGQLIYSRHHTGRFPAGAEIVEALRKLHPR